MTKISVVINTLNEEKNISFALRSIKAWANEIVLVDMYSDDGTVEVARSFGAKIYYHERVDAFDIARKLAIEKAENDWIFLLDADEVVPKRLSLNLLSIIQENDADIVYIPRINYIFGDIIKNACWGPNEDKQLRLFRKGKVNIKPTPHNFIIPASDAKIKRLSYNNDDIAIVHFNYIDIFQFIQKLNKYTSVEAKESYLEKNNYGKIFKIVKPLKTFLRHYIKFKGYKDGWRGLYLSVFMAFYRIVVFAKIEEFSHNGDKKYILEEYYKIAEKIISGYEES